MKVYANAEEMLDEIDRFRSVFAQIVAILEPDPAHRPNPDDAAAVLAHVRAVRNEADRGRAKIEVLEKNADRAIAILGGRR